MAIDYNIERLEAMISDDGGTWDLSENDKSAINYVLKQLAEARKQSDEHDRAVRQETIERLKTLEASFDKNVFRMHPADAVLMAYRYLRSEFGLEGK